MYSLFFYFQISTSLSSLMLYNSKLLWQWYYFPCILVKIPRHLRLRLHFSISLCFDLWAAFDDCISSWKVEVILHLFEFFVLLDPQPNYVIPFVSSFDPICELPLPSIISLLFFFTIPLKHSFQLTERLLLTWCCWQVCNELSFITFLSRKWIVPCLQTVTLIGCVW